MSYDITIKGGRSMKELIIYYSLSGNNEKLAFYLKDRVGCDIHKLSEIKKRKTISILFDFILKRNSKLTNSSLNIIQYDTIIFIGPIWGCRIASPVRTFIENHKENINNYFFITLCNGMAGQREKLENELYSIVQRKPIEVIELWINKLLPEDKQNKIKHTFKFQVASSDLETFDRDIEPFIRNVKKYGEVI
jgi:flavodoxin